MMKRGKRLAKLCNPPAGAMSDGAACRALIDYIGRLAAHYPRLTTWKSQICFRRRIDDAFAFLELICARVPDLAEDLEDLRDSVGELVAVVGAMMTWPALVIGISTSPCRDGRARIRRDRGYIGQAGPPPRLSPKAFGPLVRGAETRPAAADFRKEKPSENSPRCDFCQPEFFGQAFVRPRGAR